MVMAYDHHRKWNKMEQERVLDFWINMKVYTVVNAGKKVKCVFNDVRKVSGHSKRTIILLQPKYNEQRDHAGFNQLQK